MRAMILAAGRGERLKPLTDSIPKPLIPVNGKPLIVYHLEKIKSAGLSEVVINLHYLGNKIKTYLGNGNHWGLTIAYSEEENKLEVGGGICQALPLLGPDPFLIINGDIYTDFPLITLKKEITGLGHLILVDNPLHNGAGDFSIGIHQLLTREGRAYTYSGIGILSSQLFEHCQSGEHFRLAPLFDKAINAKKLTGEHFSGEWTDVGTLERLQNLEKTLSLSQPF